MGEGGKGGKYIDVNWTKSRIKLNGLNMEISYMGDRVEIELNYLAKKICHTTKLKIETKLHILLDH
jgi:hypothetical protein